MHLLETLCLKTNFWEGGIWTGQHHLYQTARYRCQCRYMLAVNQYSSHVVQWMLMQLEA